MKIFYFYDESDSSLKLKDQFEHSLPKDLEPHHTIIENNFCQKYHGGGYYGWLSKYNTILKGFRNTISDEYFIFSDIDIKFYKSIDISINKDIYFQNETPINNDVNIGFMIIKNCDSNISFWHTISEIVEQNKFIDSNGCVKINHRRGYGSGQFIVNDLLKDCDLNYEKLPYSFWSNSIGLDNLSKDIVLHHANVNTQKKKLDQLQYISQLIKYYE